MVILLCLLGGSYLHADESAVDSIDLEHKIVEFQTHCSNAGRPPSEDEARAIKRSIEAISEECTSKVLAHKCSDRLGAILKSAEEFTTCDYYILWKSGSLMEKYPPRDLHAICGALMAKAELRGRSQLPPAIQHELTIMACEFVALHANYPRQLKVKNMEIDDKDVDELISWWAELENRKHP